MADIKIYGRLVNATTDAEIASASQIKDPKWNDGTNNQSQINSVLKTLVDSKQTTLVSGTNIKTINGASVLGQGDITIDLSLYKVVTTLPTEGIDDKKIYLVKNAAGQGNDVYSEYIYVTADKKWEKLGEYKSTVDLTPYVKFTDLATAAKAGVISPDNFMYLLAWVRVIDDGIQSAPLAGEATATGYGIKQTIKVYAGSSVPKESTATLSIPAATSTAAGVMSAADKVKLDSLKTLAAASKTVLGGIKVGTGLDVTADGTLSVTPSSKNKVIIIAGSGKSTDAGTVKQGVYTGAFSSLTDIYYATDLNCLICAPSDNNVYTNWTGADSWGDVKEGKCIPDSESLYVDPNEGKIYKYNGTSLDEIPKTSSVTALTDAEIDAICV